MSEDFYEPSHFKKCPRCGSKKKDKKYSKCWHCAECGFATCAYFKKEIDELMLRKPPKTKDHIRVIRNMGANRHCT